MYWRRPTAEELAGTGLKPKHYQEPQVDVWPENWPAISLFRSFSTQWRIGGGGPIGLDLGFFSHELQRKGVTGDEFDETLAALAVIEQAALEQINQG